MGKKLGWSVWEGSDHVKEAELKPKDSGNHWKVQGRDSGEIFLARVVNGLRGSKTAGWGTVRSSCDRPDER